MNTVDELSIYASWRYFLKFRQGTASQYPHVLECNNRGYMDFTFWPISSKILNAFDLFVVLTVNDLLTDLC